MQGHFRESAAASPKKRPCLSECAGSRHQSGITSARHTTLVHDARHPDCGRCLPEAASDADVDFAPLRVTASSDVAGAQNNRLGRACLQAFASWIQGVHLFVQKNLAVSGAIFQSRYPARKELSVGCHLGHQLHTSERGMAGNFGQQRHPCRP